jgi:hypothetical protein
MRKKEKRDKDIFVLENKKDNLATRHHTTKALYKALSTLAWFSKVDFSSGAGSLGLGKAGKKAAVINCK